MKRDLFENIVRLWVDRFVVLEDKENSNYVNTPEVKNTRNEIYQHIINHSSDEDIKAFADELGINIIDDAQLVKDKEEFLKRSRTNLPKNRSIITNVPKEITDAVKNAVVILRQCTSQKSSTFDKDKLMKLCGNNTKQFNKMLRMKDFIDRMYLTYLYDSNKVKNDDVNHTQKRYGVVFNDDGTYDDSNLDLDDITDEHATDWLGGGKRKEKHGEELNVAKVEIAKDTIEKYCESVYGIKFTSPNFSIGNNKVKSALIINFASAFRCPAWNFCLVKHACYARGSELNRYIVKQSNDKKNLLWLKASQDETLFNLLFKLLRCCAIDYQEVAKETKQDIEKLIITPFSKIKSKKVLESIKKHKRVPYIRLNENGDFLSGDFLLKFDQTIAAEFKLIGIPSAAYTCMFFGDAEKTEEIINKVQNIVLNASRDELKGNAIARYFYAIPEELFNKFDETYGSGNNTSFVIDKDNKVGHNPQKLYHDGTNTPNGNYYYKCPCNRTDYQTLNEANEKINCYQCNLCYQPKVESITGKYYVLVIAHGSEKEAIKSNEKFIREHIGICYSMTPEGMEKASKTNQQMPLNQNDFEIGQFSRNAAKGVPSDVENGLQESINADKFIGQNLKREAFRTIGINAVNSMNEKINEITRLNEMKEDFFDKLKKLD